MTKSLFGYNLSKKSAPLWVKKKVMMSQHQNLRALRCPFKDLRERMRSLNLREEFGLTQKGSPTRGKSTSGLLSINPQESEVREERGKD